MENPDELSGHHNTKGSLFEVPTLLTAEAMDLLGAGLATEMPSLLVL